MHELVTLPLWAWIVLDHLRAAMDFQAQEL